MILATDAGLRSGFSRLLFADWADNELNTVLITSRDGDFREAKDLSSLLKEKQNQVDVSLGRRLVGLSCGEEWARDGLVTASGDTLLIPLNLSQRVPVTEETGEGQAEKENDEVARRPSTTGGTTPSGQPKSVNGTTTNQLRKCKCLLLNEILLSFD